MACSGTNTKSFQKSHWTVLGHFCPLAMCALPFPAPPPSQPSLPPCYGDLAFIQSPVNDQLNLVRSPLHGPGAALLLVSRPHPKLVSPQISYCLTLHESFCICLFFPRLHPGISGSTTSENSEPSKSFESLNLPWASNYQSKLHSTFSLWERRSPSKRFSPNGLA